MSTSNYGCVGATDKFTGSDTVFASLRLSCFSFRPMLTIVQLSQLLVLLII